MNRQADHHGDVMVAERPASLRNMRTRGQSLWFAHNSGRFDRPAPAWRDALTFLRHRSVLITGTEAAGRNATLFDQTLAGTDWSHAHLAGAAEGECYATWDDSFLESVSRPFARKLTDLTWVRSREFGGGRAAKVHALVVHLREVRSDRRWWLAVVHMPLDNTPPRAAAWVDCCRGLVDLKADLRRRDPDAAVVVVGDVNKNLREPDEALQVRRHLTVPLDAVHSWSLGLPRAGGTHGRQVIDYAILPRGGVEAGELVKDLPDSDHRGFRYLI